MLQLTFKFKLKQLIISLLMPALLVPGLTAGQDNARFSTATKVSLAVAGAALVGVAGYQLYQRYHARPDIRSDRTPATAPTSAQPSWWRRVTSTAFVGAVGLAYTAWSAMQNVCAPVAESEFTALVINCQRQLSDLLAATNIKAITEIGAALQADLMRLIQLRSPRLAVTSKNWLHGWLDTARILHKALVTAERNSESQLATLCLARYQQLQVLIRSLLAHGADFHSVLYGKTAIMRLPYDVEFATELLRGYGSQPSAAATNRDAILAWLEQRNEAGQTAVELYTLVASDEQQHPVIRRGAELIAATLQRLAQPGSTAGVALLPDTEAAEKAADEVVNPASTGAGNGLAVPGAGAVGVLPAGDAVANGPVVVAPVGLPVGDAVEHGPVVVAAVPPVAVANGLDHASDSDSDDDEFFDAQPLTDAALNRVDLPAPAVVAHNGTAAGAHRPLPVSAQNGTAQVLPVTDVSGATAESARARALRAEQAAAVERELAAMRARVSEGERLMAAARRDKDTVVPNAGGHGAAATVTRPVTLDATAGVALCPASAGVAESKTMELSRPVTVDPARASARPTGGSAVALTMPAPAGTRPTATSAAVAAAARPVLTTEQQEQVDYELLAAASKLDLARVTAAVAKGANVNVAASGYFYGPFYQWLTPLELAVAGMKRLDQLPVVEYLIAQGAQVLRPTRLDKAGMRTIETRFSALEFVYQQISAAPQFVLPLLRALAVGLKRDYRPAEVATWLNARRHKLITAKGKVLIEGWGSREPKKGHFYARLSTRLPDSFPAADRHQIMQIITSLGGYI
ncbi:MAG TPA: hypothetical protein VJJ83_02065 [Candidatus Babeliales bacterium]|nr:hypothetical protein [Candidatus Babeliales bacterium]